MVKHYTYNFNKNNHLIGVMVSILTSIEVDCRFHHLTSQIRDNKIGICCFFYLQESMEFSKYKALIYVPFCTILQHFYWWFWRKILFKDLLNFPLLDPHIQRIKLYKYESPLHKDHFCQVCFHLVGHFYRRRGKCDKINDNRQTVVRRMPNDS
jgi:hypothetical protein